MPGKNGFELLEALEDDTIPEVIFTTAYDEYALKAFQYNALDYILKPIDLPRLGEAVHRVFEEFDRKHEHDSIAERKMLGENDQVFIKDGEKCWFIDINEICMFESDGNYVKVYFDKFRPLILRSLNSLEERLDPKLFFRANRKFIINLNWVNGVENWFNGGLQVSLKDGEKVEISRRQAIRFKEMMSL
jgi:two-component system LytT family response regulator